MIQVDTSLTFSFQNSGAATSAIATHNANELAVLYIGNTDTGITSVTDSAGSTWTKACESYDTALGDYSGIFYAIITSPQTSYTVTITTNSGDQSAGMLVTYANTKPSTPIGATNATNNHSGSTAVNVGVTTTGTNSWVWGVIQSEAGVTPTIGTGQTVLYTGGVPGAATIYPVQQNSTTSSSGSSVAISTTNSFPWTTSVVEILAANNEQSPVASDSISTNENMVINIIESVSASDSTSASESVGYYSELVATKEAITINVQTPPPTTQINVNDTATTSESTDQIKANTRDKSVSDSSTTSETIQTVINSQLLVNDPIATTESIGISPEANPNINDTSTILESISLLESVSTGVSDSTSTSESMEIVKALQPNVSDLTIRSESIQLMMDSSVSVSDSTSTSENTQVLLLSPITITDSTTTSENISVLSPDLDPVVSDSTTVNESAIVLIPGAGTPIIVNDSSTISENTIVQEIVSVNVSDSTTTTENIQLLDIEMEVKSDSTTTSESIHTEINSQLIVSDSTTISENVVSREPFLVVTVSDSTTTSELVTAQPITNVNVSDSTVTSENIIISISTSGTLTVIKNDAISLSESISLGDNDIPSVSDSTTIIENIQLITYIDPLLPLQYQISITGRPTISNTRF